MPRDPTTPAPLPIVKAATAALHCPSVVFSAEVEIAQPKPVAPTSPTTSAGALAAAILASRKADPTVGGHLACRPLAKMSTPARLLDAAELDPPVLGPSSTLACGSLSAAAAALEADGGWVHVGGRRRYNRGPSPDSSKEGLERCRGAPPERSREGLERSLAFKRWARGRCFRCLERGHQVSACRGPFRCIRCRLPGHRERFCRARSPVAHECSPSARACSPVRRACHRRSRFLSVQPCSPLTRNWAEVTDRSSLRVSVPPRSPSGCCKDLNASAFLGSSLESEFALMRMELLQKVEMLRSELRDTLAKLQFASALSLPPELQVGSVDEEAEET